jgi:hypothetical protein
MKCSLMSSLAELNQMQTGRGASGHFTTKGSIYAYLEFYKQEMHLPEDTKVTLCRKHLTSLPSTPINKFSIIGSHMRFSRRG